MKKKKRAFTLLEIMIAILIITLITGAIGYNMRGTLEKGKAFRTEQGMEQLQDLLQICVSEEAGQHDINAIANNPTHYLEKTGLAKDPKKLVLDGWGHKFNITVDNGKFKIESDALENYKNRNKKQ